MRVVEKFYSVGETAMLLSVCTKTIRRQLSAGAFVGVVNVGGGIQPDYRIPTSAINAWLERRRVFTEPGIAARCVGELRRKAQAAAG